MITHYWVSLSWTYRIFTFILINSKELNNIQKQKHSFFFLLILKFSSEFSLLVLNLDSFWGSGDNVSDRSEAALKLRLRKKKQSNKNETTQLQADLCSDSSGELSALLSIFLASSKRISSFGVNEVTGACESG